MRIFITGATGVIGSAVAKAVLARGHEVAALVRPTTDDSMLRSQGAVIVRGLLSDLPDLDPVLRSCAAFIHCANAGASQAAEFDRIAIDSMTRYAGHFIYTSGIWVLGNTGDTIADEKALTNPLTMAVWRARHEPRVLDAGTSGVTTSVLRAGCVYGGRQSLLREWFVAADRREPIRIIGDGKNRWGLVHIDDLADLYVRALESRVTGILHGVDDSDATIEAMALAVSESSTHVPVERTPLDEARRQLGPFADALAADQRVASDETRRSLGWTPKNEFLSSVDRQWNEWRAARNAGRE